MYLSLLLKIEYSNISVMIELFFKINFIELVYVYCMYSKFILCTFPFNYCFSPNNLKTCPF